MPLFLLGVCNFCNYNSENGQSPLKVLYCDSQVGFPGQQHFTNAAAFHCWRKKHIFFAAATLTNMGGRTWKSVPVVFQTLPHGAFSVTDSSLYLCCCLFAKSRPALCDPMDYSPPGCSVHAISQAKILEWVAVYFSSQPRDWTCVSCLVGRFFTTAPPGKISLYPSGVIYHSLWILWVLLMSYQTWNFCRIPKPPAVSLL